MLASADVEAGLGKASTQRVSDRGESWGKGHVVGLVGDLETLYYLYIWKWLAMDARRDRGSTLLVMKRKAFVAAGFIGPPGLSHSWHGQG